MRNKVEQIGQSVDIRIRTVRAEHAIYGTGQHARISLRRHTGKITFPLVRKLRGGIGIVFRLVENSVNPSAPTGITHETRPSMPATFQASCPPSRLPIRKKLFLSTLLSSNASVIARRTTFIHTNQGDISAWHGLYASSLFSENCSTKGFRDIR